MSKTLFQKYVDQRRDCGLKMPTIAKEVNALFGTKYTQTRISDWYAGRRSVPLWLQNHLRQQWLFSNHPRLARELIEELELDSHKCRLE